jgi:hypothetical protein
MVERQGLQVSTYSPKLGLKEIGKFRVVDAAVIETKSKALTDFFDLSLKSVILEPSWRWNPELSVNNTSL